MTEPTASLESKLRLIQQVIILAAWTEDARRALDRVEEITEFYPDIGKRLSELGYANPISWSQPESEALVGIMQMADQACRESEELRRQGVPRPVGGAAAALVPERGGVL